MREITSVLEVLNSSMGKLPTFNIVYFTSSGRLKDRVLKHDLLHVLLINRSWPVTFRFEDEYFAAVIQAVLTRDRHVSARSVSRDATPADDTVPTVEEICETTIPGVVAFLRNVLAGFRLHVPDDFRVPNRTLVSEYYELGQLFAEHFSVELGEDYASVPAETLQDVPFSHVARSFRLAVEEHRRVPPPH